MKNFRMPKDSAEDPLIPELLIRFNHRGLPQGKNIYKRSNHFSSAIIRISKTITERSGIWASGIETSYILIITNSSLSN